MPRKLGQPRNDKRLPGLPRKGPEPPTAERNCLRCQDPFPSTGPGHRLCAGCREQNAKLSLRDVRRPVALPPGVVLPSDGQEG